MSLLCCRTVAGQTRPAAGPAARPATPEESARDGFAEDCDAAERSYKAAVDGAAKTYRRALGAATDKATTAGDRDEVNRLATEEKRLGDRADADAAGDPPRKPAAKAGRSSFDAARKRAVGDLNRLLVASRGRFVAALRRASLSVAQSRRNTPEANRLRALAAVAEKADVTAAAADSVVFAASAGGSFSGEFADVRTAVKAGVADVPDGAKFDVMFFSGGAATTSTPALRAADEGTRRVAGKFIDQSLAAGNTDVVPGVKAAAALRPARLVLFVNNVHDPSAVVKAVEDADPLRRLTLDVRLYRYYPSDDNGPTVATALRKLADDRRGELTVVK